jgi:NADPH2:quinone reductase
VSGTEWRVRAFGEPRDSLVSQPLTAREPGPGEVLVRVAAGGLNFLDVAICRSQHPVRPELPYVPGAEVAGTVVAAGEGVTEPRVGTRVAAMSPVAYGCFASEIVLPAVACYPVPDEVPDEHAAALLVTYQTAYTALRRRAELAEGEWLLVHAGAGALGTALIQVGRALGAQVVATAGSDEKLEVCRAQGAAVAVRYADFPAAVRDATHGRGVDVVCDQVGGEVFERSVDCVALEGRLVPLGWTGGAEPTVAAGTLVARNLTLVGVSWGSAYPQRLPEVARETHRDLLELYRSGAVRPYVGEVWDQERLPEALQRIADGATSGKQVLRWS